MIRKRDSKSQKERQELIANLRLLFDVVIDVKACFDTWWGLHRSFIVQSDQLKVLKQYSHFFQTIDQALFCSLIVGIYKLYDKKNSKISLKNLINNAQKYKFLNHATANKLFRKIATLRGGRIIVANFEGLSLLRRQRIIDDLVKNGYVNSAGVIQDKFDVLLRQDNYVGKMKSNYLHDPVLKAQIIEVIKNRRDILKKIDYLRHNYYAHIQTDPESVFRTAEVKAADLRDIVDGTIAIINDFSRAVRNGAYEYDSFGVRDNLNAVLIKLAQ